MVMSLKKGRQAAASYYTDCMDAIGFNRVDDYYAGSAKEPPGEWFVGPVGDGDRSTKLGIADGLKFADGDPDRFHNLIDGYDAEGGNQLVQNAGGAGRVAFHDLTFSSPKSVSVIWSQSNEALRSHIEQAQRLACRRALDHLSAHSITRIGKDGHQIKPAALRAAMFPHGSSREDDPQLHTHCVVFNLAEAGDNKVRSLEIAPALMHAGAATMLYRAELAWQLRLAGFEIDAKDGNFEIRGVPDPVMQHFSKRREQIKQRVAAQLQKMGLDASQATKSFFDVAAVESRSAKGQLTRVELLDMWHKQGHQLGFSAADIDQLIKQGIKGGFQELSGTQLLKEAEEALGTITETRAVFNAAHLLTAVAAKLLGRASPEQIQHAVKMVLPQVLFTTDKGKQLYTTGGQLAKERQLLKLARTEDISHQINPEVLPLSLTAEQREAAEGVLCDTRMCSVIEGTAGAGKTFTVGTVANAYRAEGYTVTAMATSWAAAQNLQGAAALDDGVAITAFAHQVRKGLRKLGPRDVLIVDEAGQSGVQDLRDVLAAADQVGAKVILLGDTKQQKAVSAGDGLRLVASEVGSWRLDEIRRQRNVGDREAVKSFFDGKADKGLAHYETEGNIHIEVDRDAQLARLVADWQKARKETRAASTTDTESMLIVAHDRATTRSLNELAHRARKEAGELGHSVQLHTMDCGRAEDRVEFSEGDQVVFRVNVKDQKVNNRTRGTVESVEDDGCLVIRVHHPEGAGPDHLVQVDQYDEAWHHPKTGGLGLQHGYCWTAFSSQGQTVERCFVADSIRYARDSAGVAMSRHKGRCDLYVSHAERHRDAMSELLADDWTPPAEFTRSKVLKRLAATWSRNSIKANAVDHLHWCSASTGAKVDLEAEDAIAGVKLRTQQRRDQAQGLAEAAIERAKRSPQPCPLATSLPPAADQLVLHGRDEFVLQIPKPVAEDVRRSIDLLVEQGVDLQTIRSAAVAKILRFGPGGEPLYAGQRDDGQAMRLLNKDGKDLKGRLQVLRKRFTPVLAGDPFKVMIVSDGLAALQFRTLDQRQYDAGNGPEPATVIVARSADDLSGAAVQWLIARAEELYELTREQQQMVAKLCVETYRAAQALATKAAAEFPVQPKVEPKRKVGTGPANDAGPSP